MVRTVLKIEGMSCGMCEAHICDVIRRAVPGAKKVSASHKRGEASFLSETPAEEAPLKAAIAATGYTCLSAETAPEERKGLFRRR